MIQLNLLKRPKIDLDKKCYSFEEIIELPNTVEDIFLWGQILPKVGLGILSGPSDCGKSTLMRQLALSIVTNQAAFLEEVLNIKHGNVCYVATEDSPYGTKLVIEKQFAGIQKPRCGKLHFIYDSSNVFVEIEKVIIGNPVDLIIVDGWADTFTGCTNNAIEVRQDLTKWQTFARKHQCCVLLLHHNVKNSENSNPDKNKMNGSQAIEAKVRIVIELRMGKQQDERLFTITKGNYLPPEMKGNGRILKLDGNTLLFSSTGNFERGIHLKAKAFDKALWFGRLKSEMDAASITMTAAIKILQAKFSDCPGKTWFIENQKFMVGLSDTSESERPTTLKVE